MLRRAQRWIWAVYATARSLVDRSYWETIRAAIGTELERDRRRAECGARGCPGWPRGSSLRCDRWQEADCLQSVEAAEDLRAWLRRDE